MPSGFPLVLRIDPKLKAALDKRLGEVKRAHPGWAITRADLARDILARELLPKR